LVTRLTGERNWSVPYITQVRPGIDVISGGEKLNDLAAMLVARGMRGGEVNNLLAASLAELMQRRTDADGNLPYDLILIDCPPGEPTLQLLALCAARWLVIPTKADNASLRGMAQIASRVVEARQYNETVDLLGVVLCDIVTSAKRLRRDTEAKITTMLSGAAPLFSNVIRNSTSAYNARDQGLLAFEYSEQTSAEPFWEALKAGRSPKSIGSAPALAEDYVLLADEILRRIAALEGETLELEAVQA
jgi:chromosome partitioning protein